LLCSDFGLHGYFLASTPLPFNAQDDSSRGRDMVMHDFLKFCSLGAIIKGIETPCPGTQQKVSSKIEAECLCGTRDGSKAN
jgi:hypothetical protein